MWPCDNIYKIESINLQIITQLRENFMLHQRNLCDLLYVFVINPLETLR